MRGHKSHRLFFIHTCSLVSTISFLILPYSSYSSLLRLNIPVQHLLPAAFFLSCSYFRDPSLSLFHTPQINPPHTPQVYPHTYLRYAPSFIPHENPPCLAAARHTVKFRHKYCLQIMGDADHTNWGAKFFLYRDVAVGSTPHRRYRSDLDWYLYFQCPGAVTAKGKVIKPDIYVYILQV